MKKTALVIMAAGIGSRFGGGIKQLEPVGPNGEIIMDYSIYDAKEAGFDKVVFIIRKDIEEEFQIRKSTVTGILKLMEKHGYIYRESVKKDARLKRIVPTAKAEEMRPKILEHIQKTEARLIEGIAPEDVLICKKALGQMLCNLSEMNKEENQKDE